MGGVNVDLYENFKTRGEITEAMAICEHATIGVMHDSYNCYCKAYEACKRDDDRIWKQNKALSAVYMLGFISGARAVRERRSAKKRLEILMVLSAFTHS